MYRLNDSKLRAIKEQGKYSDGGGLYLHVLESGSKSWRIAYRFEGKQKTFVLGMYPSLTLSQARKEHIEFKEKLKAGIDPSAEKKEIAKVHKEEIENTFESLAFDWLDKKQENKTEKHRKDIISKLERYVYPTFRTRGMNTISSKEMLDCIRKIEAKGVYETAKKVLGICSQIFSFAVGESKADTNICADLSKQLKAVERKHFAFITDKKLLAKLLNDIDLYPHGELVKIGLQIAPLVFLRPSELIQAKWSEIDFDSALWTIPEERMKLRKKHLIPLSTQVFELLKKLYEITGDTNYLFANWNNKNKPITIDGLRQGLRRLGYGKEVHTPHGFRHTASTLLNELQYTRDHIEKQLAHSTGNTVRGTYNHAEYLPERKKMLQEWADYLDELKAL